MQVRRTYLNSLVPNGRRRFYMFEESLVSELTIRTDRLEQRLLFVQGMLEKSPNDPELRERVRDIKAELERRKQSA